MTASLHPVPKPLNRAAASGVVIGTLLAACSAEPLLDDQTSPTDQHPSETVSTSAADSANPGTAASIPRAPHIAEDALTTGSTSDARGPSSESTDAQESRRCPQVLGNAPSKLDARFSVALNVHTPRSQLSEATLCAVLEELNQIWWQQAGLCFQIDVVEHDQPGTERLDLWFESSPPFPNGVEANGVYSGPHAIYSLDNPDLLFVSRSVRYPAARTAAHELGHALGLSHQNCGKACLNLLMTSGTTGYHLSSSHPADTDEIADVREIALRSTAGPAVHALGADESCEGARLPVE